FSPRQHTNHLSARARKSYDFRAFSFSGNQSVTNNFSTSENQTVNRFCDYRQFTGYVISN
ncbi:MAG TPA: hypothetical protein VK517_10835, partial [Cyclobacteriaceae bacterium]|nr:hypothetical protein [Cyclobacteriaceae bacterium]